MPSIKIDTLRVSQLKAILEAHNLPTRGRKAELLARILGHSESDEIDANELENMEKNYEDADSTDQNMQQLTRAVENLTQQFVTLLTTLNSDRSTSSPTATTENATHASPSSPLTSTFTPTATTENATHASPSSPLTSTFTPTPPSITATEIQNLIPEYHPSEELAPTAEQYVDRINTLIQLYAWNEKTVLYVAQTKMRGPAKQWSDSLLGEIHSWQEFSRRLIVDFGKNENEADIHFRMSSSTRKQGENVIDYFYRMRALGQKHRLSDPAIIKYIRCGINHNEIQTALAATHLTELNDMRNTIERFFANRPTGLLANKPRKNTPQFEHLHNGPPRRDTAPGSQFTISTRQSTSPVICYNCSEAGHISLNCTKPQKKPRCNICRRTTHLEISCPERGQTSNVKSNVLRISNEKDVHSNRTKVVTINDHTVQAFVDPGSDRSLIRYSLAREIGVIQPHDPFTLNGFAGGKWCGNSCVVAPIHIDKMEEAAHCFLVVQDELMPYPLFLGNDILCKNNRRLIIGKKNCHLEEFTEREIKTGDGLSPDGKEKLHEIINEFSVCFGETLDRLGLCNTITMNIALTSDTPIEKKPYRVPFAKREVIDNVVEELLKHEVIRFSSSAYSSPVVLVKKSSGEDRMCVDFRSLNAITLKKPYPMPTVEEILSMTAGKSYFTVLDLMSGYYQIPINEGCRHYTAFITHSGRYEFNRMPFGLVNAPSTFHEAISKLVAPMKGRAFSYVDEIIIPSRSVEEGLSSLKEFLQRLKDAGLTLRISKCMFLATEITFLGHRLTKDGIKPGREKTIAIDDFPQPTNVTELRRFLGMVSYFRKFVQDFAIIAKPLTSMLKKEKIESPFCWEVEQTQAFRRLKEMLCSEPILQVYDPQKIHEVHTDASSCGLAGILFQAVSESAERKPVFYYSRACTPAESKYSSYELEVLAVVESLERFRMYLLGRKFSVFTDCSAVSAIKATSSLIPRVARWWLRLQEFDFTVVHRSANRMAHVDALSRMPVEVAKEADTVAALVMRVNISRDDWIASMQHQDPRLASIVEALKEHGGNVSSVQLRQQFSLTDGRLFRKENERLKLVVPSAVRWRIVKHFHDDMGHFGVEKVLQRIQENLWFRRMRNFVKSYVSACIECCYHKRAPGAVEGRMHVVDVIPIPFRTIHIDHLGPFPRSRRGKVYIIGVADAFSKYVIVKAVRDTKAKPVIEMLNELTAYFGLPDVIISDRGTAFTAKEFETFCCDNEIRHVRTAVRTPRANGQIERLNQSILQYLRTSSDNQSDWDLGLRQLQWSINTHRNSTTGYSPNEIIFDFKLKDIGVNHFLNAVQDGADDLEPVDMQQRRVDVSRRIHEEKERWKLRFDAKHKKPTTYNEGDLVVVESVPSPTGESHKLEPKYKGPYIVEKCLRQDRYVLGGIETGRQQRRFSTVMTSDKMKPWCLLGPELGDDDDDEVGLGVRDDSTSGRAELSTECAHQGGQPERTPEEGCQI